MNGRPSPSPDSKSTLPNNQLGYIGAILSLLELVDVKCTAHGKVDGLAFLNI
jgi:hypothetical protein